MSSSSPPDETLATLLRKSKLQLPFSDFEDRVLQRIAIETELKKGVRRNIHLSMLFFALGTVLGVFLSLTLPEMLTKVGNLPIDQLVRWFQVVFVLLTISLLERVLTLWKRYRSF
ncbi:hypothetical protein SAMN05421823_104193 [Catalinimonas alkaloidigena]|uniref:Uncharacterized protein n=1 Tax=Catalinimonas alkaloidigena TaxID=1075417 RepID=A0A1G9GRR7_9BACT|nr:hypothetical protein [Catalinimonas alkaloidigena]SDL03302.1 hypothetical protein SAMN05421823_104193 [Catalinimonas alkaloidigena]